MPASTNSVDNIQNLSAKPTFDCTKARSATAHIICLDQAGANADWDLISAYWARYFSLDDNDRNKFDQAQQNWLNSLHNTCRLSRQQSTFPLAQRQCVLSAYRNRATGYRSQLRGDALVEAQLSPEQHAEVQQELITLDFLHDEADGEFGPNTRVAIKQFQTQSGFANAEFLTSQQRQQLLHEKPRTAELGPTQPPQPPEPQPPQPPKDTAKLKEARVFLEDAKRFIADQRTVPSISAIANEAATLQIALDKFDEPGAVKSM